MLNKPPLTKDEAELISALKQHFWRYDRKEHRAASEHEIKKLSDTYIALLKHDIRTLGMKKAIDKHSSKAFYNKFVASLPLDKNTLTPDIIILTAALALVNIKAEHDKLGLMNVERAYTVDPLPPIPTALPIAMQVLIFFLTLALMLNRFYHRAVDLQGVMQELGTSEESVVDYLTKEASKGFNELMLQMEVQDSPAVLKQTMAYMLQQHALLLKGTKLATELEAEANRIFLNLATQPLSFEELSSLDTTIMRPWWEFAAAEDPAGNAAQSLKALQPKTEMQARMAALQALRERNTDLQESDILKALKLDPQLSLEQIIETNLGEKYKAIYRYLSCPISYDILVNPCTTIQGMTYSRNALVEWFQDHGTDPLTNKELKSLRIVPNKVIEKLIDYILAGGDIEKFPGFIDPNTGLQFKKPALNLYGATAEASTLKPPNNTTNVLFQQIITAVNEIQPEHKNQPTRRPSPNNR